MLTTPNPDVTHNTDDCFVPQVTINQDGPSETVSTEMSSENVWELLGSTNSAGNDTGKISDANNISLVDNPVHINNGANINTDMYPIHQSIVVDGNMESNTGNCPIDDLLRNPVFVQALSLVEQDTQMVDIDCALVQNNNYDLSCGLLSQSGSSITKQMNADNSTSMVPNIDDSSVIPDNMITTVNSHTEQMINVNLRSAETMKIAQEYKFNLTIPEENEKSDKTFQIKRRSFAIACRTHMKKENIMENIQNEFNDLLQYVCISSNSNDCQVNCISSPIVYIQIIFKNIMRTKSYFLKKVAGMQCNYKVTTNDRAWNTFLKKVDKCIEVGQFQSVRARAGTKWSKTLKHKRKETVIESRMQSSYDQMETCHEKTKDAYEDILTKMKIFIEDSIIRANNEIPDESVDKRDRVLSVLNSSHLLVQFALNK